MDKSTIIKRLNELCEIANSRIPHKTSGDVVFAEICWMTDAEVSEMHYLKMLLPSYGEQALEAKSRIQKRIATRKGL